MITSRSFWTVSSLKTATSLAQQRLVFRMVQRMPSNIACVSPTSLLWQWFGCTCGLKQLQPVPAREMFMLARAGRI